MDQLRLFADAIARHMPADGTVSTILPRVKLIRWSQATMPMPVIYEASVCFVAQGRKRAMLGTTAYDYDPAHHLIASVGLPVMGTVTEATEANPYLCLQLDLDASELSELTLLYPQVGEATAGTPAGLTLNKTTPALAEAALRLVNLLDTPEDAEALAPLIIREILYRLLRGPDETIIRHMASVDSRLSQISRAIVWIRNTYTERCRIDEAAQVAGMSRSTFHLHFKGITDMTPLEFRTQLRMQEARRLMLGGGVDAASAGFAVGYDSPSQFSRDYSRLYGAPPARHSSLLRAANHIDCQSVAAEASSP